MNASPDWVQFILDLPMVDPPGTTGRYCSGGVILLGRILEKASGKRLPDFAAENLFGPLGITQYRWNFRPDSRSFDDACQLHLRPRDMAKLGLLYMNEGQWQGQQVISREWVKASLSRHSVVRGTDYGYLWWRQWLNVNGTTLERGKVYVNTIEVGRADAARRLAPGDVVRLWIDRPGSAKSRPRSSLAGGLEVVFEDDDLLVINKPAGILSVPLERKSDVTSVYEQIEDRFRSHGKRRPFVVHRIDQDTSGLVVFAKHAEAQQRLKTQFARRQPERVYLAVVYGHPEPSSGTWNDTLVWDTKALIQKETHPRDPRGTEAISDYRVVESFRDASLIEVRLRTGRRNQIRIQARLRGHTLVGEERYVYGPDALRAIKFGRQALHAYRLRCQHPADGGSLTFEAPLPADFEDLLGRLRRTVNR